MKKTKNGAFWYVGIMICLTYIPILLTVLYSFNASKISSIWGGFSLRWYGELFRDKDMAKALYNSLFLAFSSTICAGAIGTLGALGMRHRKNPADEAISQVAMLPIMIPEIILGMVFLSIFSWMGLPFGMVTLIIAHTAFCIPYFYSMVSARLVGMDSLQEEAAMDLGAGRLRVFWDVTLPMIRPALLSAAMLSFAMSFDDVVISIFVTGPGTNTLPVKIYTTLKTGVTPKVNALAALMLAVTLLLLGASAVFAGMGRRYRGREGLDAPEALRKEML